MAARGAASAAHHPLCAAALVLTAALAAAHGLALCLAPAAALAACADVEQVDLGASRQGALLLTLCRALGCVELTLGAFTALRLAKPERYLSTLKLCAFFAAALVLANVSRLLDDLPADAEIKACTHWALLAHGTRFVLAVVGLAAAPRPEGDEAQRGKGRSKHGD